MRGVWYSVILRNMETWPRWPQDCEVDLFNMGEGWFSVTQFLRHDCATFGSPDCYGYVTGGLKMFMADHYIQDLRKRLKGLKGRPYTLSYSRGGGGWVRDWD